MDWKDEKFDEGWFGCVIKEGKSVGSIIDHWYFVVVSVHFFYLFMMFGYTFYQFGWQYPQNDKTQSDVLIFYLLYALPHY